MAIKPIEILIKAKDEASTVLGSMQGKLTAIGAAVAAYFGVTAFVGAVRGAADLEAKLSEVKAVSGATAAEMVLLRQAAEGATGFMAVEAADALGNLTRSGLSAKDAIAALPGAMSLAKAGGISLAQSADYLTSVVMGMGLKFTESGRVADVLAQGANATKTSVTGLAQALSYAAPAAHSLGMSLETTVAIIGQFAQGGIDASRAGTALNAILGQFADPASRFRQELRTAGITTTNFEDALHQMAAAGPNAERSILAVGTEAGPALRSLLNQGIGALDDVKRKLDTAGGSAAATAGIMGDNLNGAMVVLSSTWDTVKNALTTPVLPVLKDGVTQLATALGAAVSSGTITRFGESIATAFQGGIRWAREFAGQVDFTALAARLQGYADQAQVIFTQVAEYARNAGNITQTAYGVMSAGTNIVLAAIYRLAEAFAGVASNIQSGVALLLEGLARITFGGVSASFRAAAAEVKLSAEATWATSEAFAQRADAAFATAAEGAETARRGWAGLTADTSAAATQATASNAVFRTVAETLREVGGDATATGQKAQAAGILQKEAAEATRTAVAQLKTEYEAALAAGNVQIALEKLQSMQLALKATSDQAKLTQKDIETSFTNLGITSSAELAKLRDAALRDYQVIRDAGTTTARDKTEAFKAFAEKAIAANNGVATEAIKVEAAMRGLDVQTDATGRSIVQAMGSGKSATEQLGSSVRSTTGDMQRQQSVMDKLKLTSDGLKANADGSAAGSFGSLTSNADLFTLREKNSKNQLTAADLSAAQTALSQAKIADAWLQSMRSVSPSSVSTEAMRSSQADLIAAKNILEQVMAKAAAAQARPTTASAPAAQQFTVTINQGGTRIPINTSSQTDAQNLIRVLQNAQLAAGG